ncbi:hypothetical protein Q4Q65_19770, partial [Morganella morganii]
WKIRIPLPAAEDDALMPDNLRQIADDMQRNYRTSDTWWSDTVLPETNMSYQYNDGE